VGFLNSLLGMLSGGKCPDCGTPGARKVDNQIRCFNPLCKNFNPSLGGESAQPPTAPPPEQLQTPQQSSFSSGPGGPVPAGSIAIQYRNFQGQSKVFHAEIASLYRGKNHIMAKVAPKGQRISLSRDRIQNLREVEDVMPRRVGPDQEWPSARERQVLSYHKKHHSTSPLYEKVRAKYPNW